MITLQTDETPWKVIPLKYCTVSFYDFWAWTQFHDGSGYGAFPEYLPAYPEWPHFTPAYITAAHRTGYDDPLRYCLEHEFFHSYIAQETLDSPSAVLWALAHCDPPPPTTVHEEAITMAAQAFYNGQAIFATSPLVDWEKIRRDAKILLTDVG